VNAVPRLSVGISGFDRYGDARIVERFKTSLKNRMISLHS